LKHSSEDYRFFLLAVFFLAVFFAVFFLATFLVAFLAALRAFFFAMTYDEKLFL